MSNRPDYFISPRGHLWSVMAYFNARKVALLPDYEVPEGASEPPWVSGYNQMVVLKIIQAGLSMHPANQAEIDHVVLVRIVKDKSTADINVPDGYPRLIASMVKLAEMEEWKALKRAPDFSSKTRIYDIEGESAKLESLHGAVAIMRWCHELEGFPRREWTFPLYRWQLALAALGPVSFEMMSMTYDATEDEI